MTPPPIDLNADLGEGRGPDDELLEVVTSANLACGAHAGDPPTMLRLIRAAASRGVGIGAHPGYFDRPNCGRQERETAPQDVFAACLYQVGALQALCAAEGVRVVHVKPHGALYNQAARSPALARAIAEAVARAGGGLILLGPPASALESAAAENGVGFASEAFADRAYLADGRLAPRALPGAVIHDPEVAALRALRLVLEHRVAALDGGDLEIHPRSLCLHGDTEGAVAIALALRSALERAGVPILPLSAHHL